MKNIILCIVCFGVVIFTGSITYSEVALDQYGGFKDLHITAGGATWATAKVGDRWFLVTPDGNAFISLGVYSLGTGAGTDDDGNTYYDNWISKYNTGGDLTANFCGKQLKRLRDWGFNSILEYAYSNCQPYTSVGSTDPNRSPTFPFPINGGDYSRRNVGGLIDGHVKEIIRSQGWNVSGYGNYNFYGAKVIDYFDPKFEEYVIARLDDYADEAASPWTIAFSYDEGDVMYGFSAGPGWGGVVNDHIGLVIMCVPPTQTMSPRSEWTYTDTETYSKTALADFLEDRYTTIAALNAAWGSNYTTFGSDGGWGAGSGILDEDGRASHKAWLGTDRHLYDGTCTPAVQRDLDDFLYLCADKYFSIYYNAINDVYPDVIQSGPTVFGSWYNPPRQQVLEAAGPYLDLVRTGVGDPQVEDKIAFMMEHLGREIPMMRWSGATANPDSALHSYIAVTVNDSDTQEERAAFYAANLYDTMHIKNAAGTYLMVGNQFFSWVDHWTEDTNWGLISNKDNAYDSVEAVVATGTDADGYAIGGEDFDYGDFITPLTAANVKVFEWVTGPVYKNILGAGSINSLSSGSVLTWGN